MKFVSEITKHGLKPGIICNTSVRNCVHFSLEIYDAAEYSAAAKRLAEGDLSLPARIGYPPRGDAELILNYDAVFDSGAELMQEEAFAVTSKAFHTIPWQCIEVAICRKTRVLVWVNPDFYDKWLIRQVNVYGDGASSSSSSTVPPHHRQHQLQTP